MWQVYVFWAVDERLMKFVLCRIQTWALEEARRRLEAEGILEDPSPGTGKVGWDQSSYRPGGKDSSWPKE